jgi:hypothetical protein
MKLHYSIKTNVEVLSMIDPNMFYKNKNRNLLQKKLNKPIIKKIKQWYVYGSIGLLVAYPTDIFQESICYKQSFI